MPARVRARRLGVAPYRGVVSDECRECAGLCTYDEVLTALDNLESAAPEIAQVVDLGNSWRAEPSARTRLAMTQRSRTRPSQLMTPSPLAEPHRKSTPHRIEHTKVLTFRFGIEHDDVPIVE